MNFRFYTFIVIIVLGVRSIGVAAAEVPSSNSPKRPNFIVIVSDDQRFDQFTREIMPATFSGLVDRGTTFSKAYITNPACCPSRAGILTGSYNSRNRVYGNRYPLDDDQMTVAHYLHREGYHTGLVGKFLNSWDGTPRKEYDYWFSHRGALLDYNNPTLNKNGTIKTYPGYATDVLFTHALEFIQQASEQKKPFFLLLTPNSPHEPATPPEKYEHLFPKKQAPRNPNYNVEAKNKPAHVAKAKALTRTQQEEIDEFYRDQLRTLRSLDDGIGAVLKMLKEQTLLENTALFFISDNGVFLGEFHLKGKSRVYEPAIHVPLVMRYDPVCKAGESSSALVANIDITPTILHLAGIPIPSTIDGKSLQSPCTGNSNPLRKHLLIESWGNRHKRGTRGFMALHTGDTVYIENEGDISEYYTLTNDPFQLNNRISIGNYLAAIANDKAHLHQLVSFLRGSVTYDVAAKEVEGFGGAQHAIDD